VVSLTIIFFSSLWSGLKSQAQLFMDNSRWQIGNGSRINFWTQDWCGSPLSTILNIPRQFHSNLHATVSNFIVNQQWHIPWQLQQMFPNLVSHVNKIAIPLVPQLDKLLWKHIINGDLTLKDAYLLVSPSNQKLRWAKSIWNNAIPPPKSFMMWRLLHNGMPTDENLVIRGFLFPSMCNLCCKHSESTTHLFLQCPFALSLWNWSSSIINLNVNLTSINDVLSLANRGWSPQCQLTIIAAIVSIFNNIWPSRNSMRFKNVKPNIRSSISLISSSISIAGNFTSLASGHSMTDFAILKFF
jgi:hypothetical protein